MSAISENLHAISLPLRNKSSTHIWQLPDITQSQDAKLDLCVLYVVRLHSAGVT